MMLSRNKLSVQVSFFRLTLALILGGALLLLAFADGQQRSKTPETPKPQVPPQQGGASTGGVFAPVLDEKRRPITAGGFVDGAPTATGRGLDRRHFCSSPRRKAPTDHCWRLRGGDTYRF